MGEAEIFFEDLVSSFAKKLYLCAVLTKNAPVVELVDTLDLGSSAVRRVSSSLIRRTEKETAGISLTVSFGILSLNHNLLAINNVNATLE